MKKNLISIVLVIVGLLVSFMSFVLYTKYNSSKISILTQNEQGNQGTVFGKDIVTPLKNDSTIISTTTTSGNVITIEISPCDIKYNNEKRLCFGSGMYNYTESEGVWLYDLVSDDMSDRFGGGIVGDNNLFLISLAFNKHKITDQEYEFYRKEIIRLLKLKSKKIPTQ
jgi:hypothetical protein